MHMKLRIVIGHVAQDDISLTPDSRWLFGRSPECDVVLDDARVSREHFALETDAEGRLLLATLAPKNPVFVNGKASGEVYLSVGDVIRVGRVTMRVCVSESKAGTTSVKFVGSAMPATRVSVAEWDGTSEVDDAFPPESLAQRLQSIYELSVTLAGSVDLDTLFGDFARRAMEAVPADRALIALGDPHADQFSVVKVASREGVDVTAIEMSETVLEEIQLRRTSLLVHDVGATLESTANDSIENLGIESFMCAPLFAQGDFLGLMYLDQQADAARPFERHDLYYVQVLARLLALAVADRLVRERLTGERHALSEELRRDESIVATSNAMLDVMTTSLRYAQTDEGVLLVGEPGTGKRTVGEWIHLQSKRSDRPIVAVDCMNEAEIREAITRSLVGGPLSAGGTLLLAHAGSCPVETQAWLASILDDRRIRPEGSSDSVDLDIRVVATHVPRNPGQGPPEEELSDDLARHLCSVKPLVIPPVRDRDEDVIRLAEFFLPEELDLQPAARRAVLSYAWPGNVTEVRGAMEESAANATNDAVRLSDLPRSLMEVGRREPVVTRVATLREVEMRQIRRALEVFDGNKKRTAEALGISRETLYQKIKVHGL